MSGNPFENLGEYFGDRRSFEWLPKNLSNFAQIGCPENGSNWRLIHDNQEALSGCFLVNIFPPMKNSGLYYSL